MQPALFLSHGSPMLALGGGPARNFLARLPEIIGRPKAIVVASAHWETPHPMVTTAASMRTIHDFGGFPAPLYALRYDAPGDPALAGRILDLLGAAGLRASGDERRGLDHGAWIPLLLAWPAADIPVLQVSVQGHLGPAHHLDLGRALAPLREQGVLLIGSGSFTHDLSRYRGQSEAAPEAADVAAFAAWMEAALLEGRRCDLLAYRHQAPHAEREHPTEEHLLPLFFALGAGGEGARAELLHRSTSYGVLRMDAYAFH
jgi:4,5-DOPA dioxygenase extradiol